MMADNTPGHEQVSAYYDGHARDVQQRVGLNRRHRSIFRRLLKSGLHRSHRVLEVGCGVGQLTGLMAAYLKQGSVHAVDISSGAIELARRRCAHVGQVSFEVGDMSDFRGQGPFDRILLPDVLEHIPVEQHAALFRTLARHLAPDGLVCIHIPDPAATRWARKHRPDTLQIIDQELELLPIAERFQPFGLAVLGYERYSIWTKEPDYDWIMIGAPERDPVRRSLPRWRQYWEEFRSRIA